MHAHVTSKPHSSIISYFIHLTDTAKVSFQPVFIDQFTALLFLILMSYGRAFAISPIHMQKLVVINVTVMYLSIAIENTAL